MAHVARRICCTFHAACTVWQLAQIGVTGPSAPAGGWKPEDMAKRVANFDPRYPGVVTIQDADVAIQIVRKL
jgi:hypothetical protein